ncbi:MAG TPA: hypothetical protein VH230_05000 [Stellaceae bacterium]|nr:hypothetical protein [Stellaceae bacterium]
MRASREDSFRGRLPPESAIARAGASPFFVVAAIGSFTVVTVVGPMILFSVGVGEASPIAITAAISTDPRTGDDVT